MRALVTGAAGFVGRHMSVELSRRGFYVDAVDIQYSDAPDDLGPGRINFYWQDAIEFTKALVADITSYDLIVHCAYNVGGRAAIDGKNMHFARNLRLDAEMFRWAVFEQPQARFLYFSSSAAYPVCLQSKEFQSLGNPYRLTETDIDLTHPLNPDANYGWAKLTGERLAEDARKNGLAVSVVRPFSGYGEDQSLDYPFPSIVARASAGDLSVWGPPGQTRDWIHISDIIAGSLAVVESATEDPVNLCTGRGVEMGDLAMLIAETAGVATEGWRPIYDESKPTGVYHRVGDPTRFNQYYTPKVTLEEGIERALRAVA